MFFDPLKKKKNDLILIKPIKKSNYLKNLEKQRYEGLKLIEEEKADILVDKILRRDRINRDYSVFSRYNFLDFGKKNILIDNNEKKIGNIKYYSKNNKNQKINKINSSSNFSKNNNINLNNMSKETFITRSIDKNRFLSNIGNDIVNTKNISENNKKLRYKKKYS